MMLYQLRNELVFGGIHSSNLGRDNIYPEWRVSWFSHILRKHTGVVSGLDRDCFAPDTFQVIIRGSLAPSRFM
jgi:hypothetical protein